MPADTIPMNAKMVTKTGLMLSAVHHSVIPALLPTIKERGNKMAMAPMYPSNVANVAMEKNVTTTKCTIIAVITPI